MLLKHPWLPNLEMVNEILKEIGVNSLDDLFSDVPEELKLIGPLNIGKGRPLSEVEIENEVETINGKNVKLKYPPFLGMGAYPHYTPEVVKAIIGRSEFYTSYTPYQPEMSQGLLQALFEYQSLVADLFDLDVANSSLYDWGSALAESALMSYRVTGRRKVVIAGSINPRRLSVLKTWTEERGIKVIETGTDPKGMTNMEGLSRSIDGDTAMVYIEQPNFLGIFEENEEGIIDQAHRVGALAVVGGSPLALGLIKSPGSLGADIAISDGQELGLPLNFGGPYNGIMVVRWDGRLVRQMPGRIVGMTRDSEGRSAYTLILQTREQFTRREKATSNITTNEALVAIANAVFLSLLGYTGLSELAREIYKRSHYAVKLFRSCGKDTAFPGDFFEEFIIKWEGDYNDVHRRLLSKGIHGGVHLLQWGGVLTAVTEVHSKESIEELVGVSCQ